MTLCSMVMVTMRQTSYFANILYKRITKEPLSKRIFKGRLMTSQIRQISVLLAINSNSDFFSKVFLLLRIRACAESGVGV